MYRMILIKNGEKIVSPIICPNNPKHSFKHKSILKEIDKTGNYMIKNKIIDSYTISMKGEIYGVADFK